MSFAKSAALPRHRHGYGLRKASSRGSLDNSLPNLVSLIFYYSSFQGPEQCGLFMYEVIIYIQWYNIHIY